jgi:hypothetical protein
MGSNRNRQLVDTQEAKYYFISLSRNITALVGWRTPSYSVSMAHSFHPNRAWDCLDSNVPPWSAGARGFTLAAVSHSGGPVGDDAISINS